jgi:hypothetical protein
MQNPFIWDACVSTDSCTFPKNFHENKFQKAICHNGRARPRHTDSLPRSGRGVIYVNISVRAVCVAIFAHSRNRIRRAEQSLRRLCCFALGRKINYFCSPPRCIVNKKPAKIKYWTGPWGKEEHSTLRLRERAQADSLLNSLSPLSHTRTLACKAAAAAAAVRECACVCGDRLVISGGNGAGRLAGWLLGWPDPLKGFVLYLPACQPEWCSKVSPRRLNHSPNTLGARPNISIISDACRFPGELLQKANNSTSWMIL